MSLNNNKIESGKRNVTPSDVIKVTIVIIILGSIMLLQYMFPNNPFVMKYFSGNFGVLWFLL
jgi:hypothetical protein